MFTMFLDWLFGRKSSRKPPRQTAVKSEAPLLQQLHGELLQTLGFYDPGQPPVVFSPLQTRNRWSRATLVHEEAHQSLTINTAYGALFQILSRRARKGMVDDLLSLCLRAQWGVQEGTATYLQMTSIARDDPEGLDEAVSLLPSEELGQPAYREWFDRLNRLLPVHPVSSREDLLRVSDQADFVVGMASYALNADVFNAFPSPAALNPKTLETFLAREGPDVRLVKTLVRLTQGDLWNGVYGEFRTLCDSKRDGQLSAEKPLEWLMNRIASIQPAETYVDNSIRRKRSEELFRAWDPTVALKRTEAAEVGFVEEIQTPSLKYVPDWAERFPDAFPEETLTVETFRAQVAAVHRGEKGLACSIAMFRRDELDLTTMPYPRGNDVNPSSWEDILKVLENAPTQGAVLGAEAVVAVFEEFPDAPLWVGFIRSSWRVWDEVVSGRTLLRRSVQGCLEVELSETGLRELLAFRDLDRDSEYTVFQVHGEQYAACIFDPKRPGVYALQAIAGDAGLQIFERLVNRLRLRPLDGRLSDLPHATLIRLAGQGFLL